MRVPVCRCFRGASISWRSIPSMSSRTASNFGAARSGVFRAGGSADARACRIVRRCTRNRLASALIDNPSTLAARRICANSSTLDLTGPSSLRNANEATLCPGPNQTDNDTPTVDKLGQIKPTRLGQSRVTEPAD
jgi:hypothetical protein